MREDLIENFCLSADILVVFNNPVDIDRVRKLSAEPVETKMLVNDPNVINIVSVGRLAETKGFDLLVDALAINADPRFHLTLLGEGLAKEALQAQAIARGIARIRFISLVFRTPPKFTLPRRMFTS